MTDQAFHSVLQKHRDRVFSHACYFLRNREDAEDVTQEVFIRLWTHWQRVDPEKVDVWIMKVAHNLCIDCCRRRARMRREETPILDAPDSLGVRTRDNDCDPERALDRSEVTESLLKAMAELPDETRGLLLLNYFQGLSHEEIGNVLGMSPNAVKVAIHRGRKKLKEVLMRKHPEWVEERNP
jgi:RNA polymerase sigma factor (sigma-70 family)